MKRYAWRARHGVVGHKMMTIAISSMPCVAAALAGFAMASTNGAAAVLQAELMRLHEAIRVQLGRFTAL
jgi:hypothetical protein